ncbi:uncharacterized protein LOC122319114 isoform X2 [Carya illinoinensis]|uniref:uncharacterized protein LOC122319114 isoform X2 n=1 Tax=Carya illinoinensis TaxID=32201 RepID=UPI001C723979|nr:uncharacterized protein LOC122319114 isoform X2 [Carya illinoinensis]
MALLDCLVLKKLGKDLDYMVICHLGFEEMDTCVQLRLMQPFGLVEEMLGRWILKASEGLTYLFRCLDHLGRGYLNAADSHSLLLLIIIWLPNLSRVLFLVVVINSCV